MKTTKSYLRAIWDFVTKIATAVISGLPREKVPIKPIKKSILQKAKGNFKPDIEKHYHRPTAKPVVEKQTLLKEAKKAKVAR